MMLQALYELAQREGLLENPDFEKKKVDLYLRVDAAGTFLGLENTGPKIGQGQIIDVPRLPKRSSGIAAGFLFDNAQYVLGVGTENQPGRNERCAQAYRSLVEKLAAQTQDEGALAAARFLARSKEQLASVLAANPFGGEDVWTGSEYIAFRYDPDNSVVHLREKVMAYWSALRACEEDGQGSNRTLTCLVTGQEVIPTRLHPAVKRIPGAQTSGATLVSFNADAFLTHGLTHSENAPISRAAAEGYVTALNWLLEPSQSPPRRFRYGVPLGEDAVAVFWTRDKDSIVDDLMSLFAEPDFMAGRRATEAVATQLEGSLFRGTLPGVDVTPFYSVVLSGNARVIVRDWIETTAATIRENLKHYFADLHLGAGEPQPVPLRSLLKSIEAPGRELPAMLATRLLRCALRAELFPRQLLSAALSRLRLPPDKQDERRLLRLRCAIVKASLLRSGKEVSVSLDETNTRVSYLLGRLFAVLENLQGAALGDINATIRDRYFGAASSTPAVVFPRLLRLSVHHVAKSERHDLEKAKSRIIAGLPAQPFPRFLDLEDQGLFAVGYYHQREKLFEKKTPSEPKAGA